MANKIKQIPVVGKVGEVSISPRVMQKSKPEPAQAARAKLSPDEQKKLDKALLATAIKYSSNRDEEVERLLKAGATLDADELSYYSDGELDGILGVFIRAEGKTGQDLHEIISKIADAFVSDGYGMSGWSHSLCHNFEQYDPSAKETDSILSRKENQDIAERLIDEVVRRMIECRQIECLPRIIMPLILYNIRAPQSEAGDAGFPFKPKSLENPEFISAIENPRPSSGIYENETIPKILDFCKAKSFAEFLSEPVVAARSRPPQEVRKGLFVDVDRTLLDRDHLNKKVLAEMEKSEKEGVQVVVFTGGSPEEARAKLLEAGLDEKFANVQSKNDFVGMKLERLIDDTMPEYQGFVAEKWEHPYRLASESEYS